MKCPSCNKKNPEGNKFCIDCGYHISEDVPNWVIGLFVIVGIVAGFLITLAPVTLMGGGTIGGIIGMTASAIGAFLGFKLAHRTWKEK